MEQCPQISSISAYHDGELNDTRRADVEAHLKNCAECAAELVELRRLSGLIAGEAVMAIPPEFTRKLHGQVDEMTDSSVLRFAQILSGIAAVLMIGVGGWLLATPEMPARSAPEWERAAVTLSPETGTEAG